MAIKFSQILFKFLPITALFLFVSFIGVKPSYALSPSPRIASVSPLTAYPGDTVTIKAVISAGNLTGFGSAKGVVCFQTNYYGICDDGPIFKVKSWTPTKVIAVVVSNPEIRAKGSIGIQMNNPPDYTESNYVPFNIDPPKSPPHINSVSPNVLKPGMVFTISGSGFGNFPDRLCITIPGLLECEYGFEFALISWSATQIKAQVVYQPYFFGNANISVLMNGPANLQSNLYPIQVIH